MPRELRIIDQPDHPFFPIVADLRKNWRVKHPTKYEQALEIFGSPNNQVDYDRITEELFRGDPDVGDPEQQASVFISKLCSKLEEHGFLEGIQKTKTVLLSIPNKES